MAYMTYKGGQYPDFISAAQNAKKFDAERNDKDFERMLAGMEMAGKAGAMVARDVNADIDLDTAALDEEERKLTEYLEEMRQEQMYKDHLARKKALPNQSKGYWDPTVDTTLKRLQDGHFAWDFNDPRVNNEAEDYLIGKRQLGGRSGLTM